MEWDIVGSYIYFMYNKVFPIKREFSKYIIITLYIYIK